MGEPSNSAAWRQGERRERTRSCRSFLGDALLYSHAAAAEPTSSSRRMMVFQGTVAGHQAVVLLDLGANANFVSRALGSQPSADRSGR